MGQYNLSKSGADIDALLTRVDNIFDLIYPVGSIYISVNNVNPSNLFGGVWLQIQDQFLLAAGSDYTAGDTGGSATHTHTTVAGTTGGHQLTVAEMPAHKHTFSNSYGWSGTDIPGASLTISGSNNIVLSPYHAYGGSTNNLTQANAGGNGSHTHPQTSVATDAKSNLPPYVVVYMWKRIT